jgi:hypothetical protein
MKKDHIPKPILERVEKELLAKEELLWVGLPKKQHIPGDNSRASKLVAVALLAMLFAGFIAYFASSGNSAINIDLIPIISVVAVIILAIGRTVHSLFADRHLLYAATNRRAIIMHRNKVQSFARQDIQFIERNMHRDGTGDIIFREEHYKRVVPVGTVITHRNERVTTGFYGIDNPAEVEALMLETFREEAEDYRHLEDEASIWDVEESEAHIRKAY